MTYLIDTSSAVQLAKVILPRKLSPKSDVVIDGNDKLIDQLSDRYEESRSIHGNVRSGDLIVLCFIQRYSPLEIALNKYLRPEDIALILFSTEEQLWYWLNTYSSFRVASLVIEANNNIQDIVSRSHAYKNVHSILIRCRNNELINLQRFSRSYIKIDGILDDDPRLLIKLAVDLALFSEEIGDQQREDENNEPEAQRNYDRAFKLCVLVKEGLECSRT